jgi:tRNA A37 threonylcarbamoyladenosine dehydratase
MNVAEPGLALPEADLERRFGGLRRLYGDAHYARLRALHLAVVGVGGVGSWAAEALARCGVAALTLIDLDHVAESNINRQVQATGRTLGMAKGEALRERIADIHPGCRVSVVDDFATESNWPAVLGAPVDAVIDACDQPRAKAAIALWARRERVLQVCVGAAGGKRQAQRVEVADIAEATHDPLLASLRQRLRRADATAAKAHAAAASDARPAAAAVARARRDAGGALGVRCVFSREPVAAPVAAPDAACDTGFDAAPADGTLNCHGYGSTVAVTAVFGLVAAGDVLDRLALA